MLDLLDLWLLRRGVPSDDRSLTFRRIEGSSNSRVIYFLPWQTPYYVAKHAGFLPLDFLACYEMPAAIVSSVPELSVAAMHRLVDDAQGLIAERGVAASDALIIGLSVGTYPATYLANRIGARLCAVAPADRADMMLWQSPAARLVKRRAQQRGMRLAHYSLAMRGCHPAHNLAGLARDSVFVMGERDPFIPPRRGAGLARAIERFAPEARVITLRAGHVKTMVSSARHQRTMAGIEQPSSWQLRIPKQLSVTQLQLPWSTKTQ
jgi:hypothetical protein